MKIINSILVKDVFLELFREMYKEVEHKKVSKSFSLSRPFKFLDLDIKLIIKFTISYEYIDNSSTSENSISINIKVSTATECIGLRKSRSYFMDSEYITLFHIIPRNASDETLDYRHEKILDELNLKLESFKLCKECRGLFLKNHESKDNDTCMNCIFDKMFHIQDCSCVICNEVTKPGEQIFTLSCCHTYHSACIMTHFIKSKKRECPLCREPDMQ